MIGQSRRTSPWQWLARCFKVFVIAAIAAALRSSSPMCSRAIALTSELAASGPAIGPAASSSVRQKTEVTSTAKESKRMDVAFAVCAVA